jgi:hypothetical protein
VFSASALTSASMNPVLAWTGAPLVGLPGFAEAGLPTFAGDDSPEVVTRTGLAAPVGAVADWSAAMVSENNRRPMDYCVCNVLR